MDIAGLSMNLSQIKAAQSLGVSILKIAMDTSKSYGTDIVQLMHENTKMLEQSVSPHLGASIDIKL